MKIKHQDKTFVSDIVYVIKKLSSDGLLKDVERGYDWPFDKEFCSIEHAKDAIDDLNKESIKETGFSEYKDLVILPMYFCKVEYD